VNSSANLPDSSLFSVPAIVLASGLNGLCTVRSLGVAGVPVWSVVSDMSQPCARSRFGRLIVRRYGETIPMLLDRLRHEHGLSGGVLLATSDASAHELAANVRSLPDGFRFAGPHVETVQLLMDKQREIEAIGGISDSLPPSLSTLPSSALALLGQLRLPVIFKPRTQEMADTLRMKNHVVHSSEELESFLKQHERALHQFVAQEVIPGGDDSIWQCNAVFNGRHELVSAFTFQKLGMSPPHYGVTTMGRSVRNDEVIDLARQIGRALSYVGPAGFEFKRDARDAQYRYIEINPRHGMTNWFDTCCGVNTAFRTYVLALGEQEWVLPPQSTELVFLDLYADLFSRLVDDGEPFGSVIRRYARVMMRARVSAYWLWRDPIPGVTALSRNAKKLVRSGVRRFQRLAHVSHAGAPRTASGPPPSP
jgi:predicted ATP-grasp superfamily ATP-dependent carboligase